MFHKAIDLKFLDGTAMAVTFQDGMVKRYDMSALFSKYPQLRALEDRELFLSGKLMGAYGIYWNDELDIEAETVYEDGETIIGFDAELAEQFAESLGAKAKFIPIAWDSKVMELNGGYIDLIWNGMTATEELGKNIDLSTPYATNYQCVVVKGDVGDYTSADSLKTKKIAVEQGSAGDSTVSALGITPNRVGSQLDALNEVAAGTSDCAVIDFTMAYSVCGNGNFSSLKIVDSGKISFDQEVFAVGLRKGSDLTEKLNSFLKTSFDNGTMKALAAKYGVGLNEDAFK